MADDVSPDERRWVADKRDFVADHRDDVAYVRDADAEARDAIADKRDRSADEREAALDAWERRLQEQVAPLDGPAEDTQEIRDQASVERRDARASREPQRQEREDRQVERGGAAATREEAADRRHAATPHTALAMAFATIAQHLYDADTLEAVLDRVVEVAVAAVAGCDSASITISEKSRFRTGASTHTAAAEVDQAQYQVHEGPSLTAIDNTMVYAPTFPDDRWPALGTRPIEYGVRSVVSYRLGGADPLTEASLTGSLNSYGDAPNAFEREAREIGLVLAAHASVAARAVQERASLERLEYNLREALSSREVIGQAKGILMERLNLTPDDAFDALRRASQGLNLKLRDIAQKLAETGQFVGPPIDGTKALSGDPPHSTA